MNGNSSKQVLLSVLGIAVLVVAVVGVSFAFFSYTKQGTQSNTLVTGQIYTYMTETDTVMLTNAMPLATDPGSVSTTVNVATDDVAVLNFSVYGKNESSSTITYKVYVEEGATPDGKSSRLYNEDVKVWMSETGHSTGTVTNVLSSKTTVSALIGNSGTKDTATVTPTLIATGTFPENSDETHAYSLNMWIGNTATISDTDTKVNNVDTKYCASQASGNNPGCTSAVITAIGGTAKYWSNSYYSLKVRVVANTTAANTGANYNGFAGSY